MLRTTDGTVIMARRGTAAALLGLMLVAGCGSKDGEPKPSAESAAATAAAPETSARVAAEEAPEATELPSDIAPFMKPWKGDLDGMIERRLVRILTVRNPVLYYVDKGLRARPRGWSR